MPEQARPGLLLGLRCLGFLAVSASLWILVEEVFWGAPARFDDAFMFTRYAKHVLAGYGHAWNPDGVQTYGCTSLLYAGWVTLAHALTRLDDAELLRGLSFSFGVASVLIMAFSLVRFARSPWLRGQWLLCLGLLAPALFLNPLFVYHARTGMDTTLSLCMNALLVLATLAMLRSGTTRSVLALAGTAYLGFLARPDNGLYAALLPTLAAALLQDGSRRKRVLWTYVLTMGVLLGLDTAAKLAVFGVSLPLPVYAKSSVHELGYAGGAQWNAVVYLLGFGHGLLPFLVLLLLCVRRATWALTASLLVPACLTLGAYFQTTQIMGYRARFSYPALPFFVMAALLCLDGLLAERGGLRSLLSRRGLPGALCAVALVLGLQYGGGGLAESWRERVAASAPAAVPIENPGGLEPVPYWAAVDAMAQIAQRAPTGTILCLSEYGVVGAAAPEVTILDPLGLHDAVVAREGFDAGRLLSQKPDVFWMPHPDYVGLRQALQDHPDFRQHYQYFPAALSYGLAVRQEGEQAVELHGLIYQVWTQLYPEQGFQKHRKKW